MRRSKTLISSILVVLLCSALACQSELDDGELLDAAADGDTRRVEELLNKGANIERYARDGWTALTVAAREAHYETVKQLLKRGANVNTKEGGGHTPLFWAREYKRQAVIDLLREAGGRAE